LEGKILSWHETEDSIVETNWIGREVIVTKFEEIQSTDNNIKQSFVKDRDYIIEKLYIDNSGFFMERTFHLNKGKWYLKKYDISNI